MRCDCVHLRGRVTASTPNFGQWIPQVGETGRRGGNGTVFICSNAQGDRAAVKVLRSRPGNERYRRFQDEVRFLSSEAAKRPGVIRLLAAYVPNELARGENAWLAMPVGVEMDVALGSTRDARAVASAIADIAETLAALQEQGVFHRDLKPSNLLRVDDEWVLADFGLVAYPEKDDITGPEHGVGSRHYIAPEVEVGAPDPDLGRADVYSLAKTLWVLVSRQRYPYAGPHHVGEAVYNLSEQLADPTLRPLDLLVEAATNITPSARPTMPQLATELRAFAIVPAAAALTAAAPDERLQSVQRRLFDRTKIADAQRRLRQERAANAREELFVLRDRGLRMAYSAFLGAFGSSGGDSGRTSESMSVSTELFERWGFGRAEGRERFGLLAGIRDEAGRMAALSAFDIGPLGECRMSAALVVEVPFGGTAIVWHQTLELIPGTAHARDLVGQLADAMVENLGPTLERFETATERARAAARPGKGDTSPPRLVDFAVDNSPLTLGGSGGTLTLRARVADEGAGVADTHFNSSPSQVRFVSPSRSQSVDGIFQPGRNLADGDSFDGLYLEHVRLPPEFESGEWQLQQLLLVDQVGNPVRHDAGALRAMGFPSAFVIR